MAALIDSYAFSNANQSAQFYSGRFGYAQSFTGNGNILGTVVLYLGKKGSPTGIATANIYNITGSFGSTSIPTGAALATSDGIEVSNLPISTGAQAQQVAITFDFTGANQITLTNGTNYCVALEYSGGGALNVDVVWVSYDSSGAAAGNYSSSVDLSTWSASAAEDFIFYVYDNNNSPSTRFYTQQGFQ